MSERGVQIAGTARSGGGDAGRNVRGGATHEPSAADAVRAAKIRRNAWLLAGLAIFFYVGYMVLIFVQGTGGG